MKQYNIPKIFVITFYRDTVWFRLFGVGLIFKKRLTNFSDRNGYKKYIKIYGWYIGTLG